MKVDLRDAGIGISLIMRGPREFAGGQVVDAMVSQVDLFPTLCDYIGIERPEWLEGRSMMPLLRREAKEIREEVFAEVNYHAAYERKRCVRTSRWKYIRNFGDYRKAIVSTSTIVPARAMGRARLARPCRSPRTVIRPAVRSAQGKQSGRRPWSTNGPSRYARPDGSLDEFDRGPAAPWPRARAVRGYAQPARSASFTEPRFTVP